ncbi:MAG: PAS domain S-box protein [Cyanobacteria bacterium SBLK]|nr:PAS domain S-box protein [Cyanobacteria bacterium SBLK]
MVLSLLHPTELERAIVLKPLIVEPQMPILDVLALMNRVRHTCSLDRADASREIHLQNEERGSCALVVRDDQLVGILTERDLVKRAGAGWNVENIKAIDMMTARPIVLRRSQLHDPFSVLSVFRQYRIRHLPIVSDEGKILGTIGPTTLRQILQPSDLLRMQSVSEVMKTDVPWVHPETPTLEIARLMSDRELDCVIIARVMTDSPENLEPLGIVTEGDIVQFQALGLDLQRIHATDVMSSSVFSLPPQISLWQAHRQMQQQFIRHLVVTGERGELLGLIAQMNILQAIEPWEMYETIEALRDRVCLLETEKLYLLKQQNSNLEQQVRDRTVELHDLNERLEQRVRERTAQLDLAKQKLERENRERNLLTQQLQQSEAKLRGLFQAMQDVVLIIGRNGKEIQMVPTNPAVSQSRPTDFMSQTLAKFRNREDRFIEIVNATLDTQNRQNFEYSIARDRETHLWFAAEIVPLSDVEVLWVARDISDRKQTEARLERRVGERTATLAETNKRLQQEIRERELAEKALLRERNLSTQVLNAAGALIVVSDREGRILRFNQTCQQTTGYRVDEIFGRYIWDFFLLPEDTEPVKRIFQQLREGKTPERGENYWLTKDGQKRLISWSNTVLTDDSGRVEYIVGTGIDITELREAERALRSSEERFRHLADNIRDVFFIRDARSDRMLYISPAFEEIWQIPCGKVYQNSQPWFDAVHPDDRDRLNTTIQRKKQGLACSEEYRIVQPNGSIRWIWERGFPVCNEQGEVETIVGISEDITERKHAEFLSQQAENALKEINEELEKRVAERTVELRETNERLTQEILQRQTIEEALWESEEELRDLFDNANDLIQSIDLEDGRILYVNRAWRTTLGYEECELAKVSIFDVMAPECKKHYQIAFQQFQNGQATKIDRVELTFLTKAGRTVILEGSINARWESGLPVSTRGIFRDITDRKQAEEKIKQQLSAIEAAADGIAILRNDTYIYLNQAHARIFGFECAEDLMGKDWQELYPPEERQRFQQEIIPILKQQKFWRGEATAQRKDKSAFPEEISLTLTEDGTLICVCQDITERKKAEAEIVQALIKEQELNDLKSRFISMTSHEFRTPLAVISSSAGILKSFSHKLSQEKKQEHLETIQTYVKHTTQLLDDILTINRAESGKMSFNPEPVALLDFCQTLIQEIQMSSDLHPINFTHHEKNGVSSSEIRVLLDKKMLRQILMNLLSNAIKYSPDGGDVGFDLEVGDRHIVFQVRDSGIGIPEDEQIAIFESFNRASNVGTIQGTGLGLSIVKRCIDLHGGQIEFTSKLGWGTRFIAYLPYHSSDIFDRENYLIKQM